MIEVLKHDAIWELRFSRPPVNAISPEFATTLRDLIRRAPAEGARAIVLSGQPNMFSAGLDVVSLLKLDRNGILQFWRDFFDLMASIARCPVPVVAAITGHSPAGGAVLAIFCDYRVMAASADPAKPFRIGLNEVQVGLTVPAVIQEAFGRLIGKYRAERLMVQGAMITAEEAVQIGMVDTLAPVSEVVNTALDWCRRHLALPPVAMSTTRRIARADLADLMGDPARFPAEDFVDSWFGDETQATLHALVQKLKGKG